LRLFSTLILTLLVLWLCVGTALGDTPACASIDFEESMLAAAMQRVEPSVDGSVLWGVNSKYAYRSVDYGATWTWEKVFGRGTADFIGLFVDSNDNLFISRAGMGVLVKAVWDAEGDTLACTDVLTYDCASCPTSDCSGFWNMAEDSSGNLYGGEYNGAIGVDTCAVVWKSEDGGDNWTRMKWAQGSRHVHLCAVNPASDDLYVSVGDATAQNDLFKSTDAGTTFASIRTSDCWSQPISMAFTSAGRVFGSDCGALGGHTNGIYRTHDDATFQECITLSGAEDNFVWAMATDASDNLVCGTVGNGHGNDSNDVRIYGSADGGMTWCTLKNLADNDDWDGVIYISQRADDQGYSYYTCTEDDGSGFDTYRFRLVNLPHARTVRALYAPRQHAGRGRSRGGRR